VLLGLFVKLQTTLAGLRSRMEDEDGAVATEYVVLLVLIAIAIIAGAAVLAAAINDKFNCASSSIDNLTNSC
jgi:Flp pilus assembly pilin Flp